jgi:S-adenosylmethionine hydrolase
MSFVKVAMITDFGLNDHYVAVTKAVILNRSKKPVVFLDVSHNVERQNIAKAAYLCAVSAKHMGKDTIHLVVVDPTVGTDRKIVVFKTENNGIFVAPDNGVLSHALEWFAGDIYYYITSFEGASKTFHARDIFAPLVAQIINGEGIDAFFIKTPKTSLVRLKFPEFKLESTSIKGSIIYVDIFGNLITNIPNGVLKEESVQLVAKNKRFRIRQCKTYAEGRKDELLLIEGSEGFYEIAINQSSANKVLQLKEGDEIVFFR